MHYSWFLSQKFFFDFLSKIKSCRSSDHFTPPTSVFMWINLALYSPLLAKFSGVGAVLGSFLPLTLPEPGSYDPVYSGLWGYKCILSVAPLSLICFPFSRSVSTSFILTTFLTFFMIQEIIVCWSCHGVTTVFVHTVASFTSSVAHDLNFGLDLLNWVQQICLQ